MLGQGAGKVLSVHPTEFVKSASRFSLFFYLPWLHSTRILHIFLHLSHIFVGLVCLLKK